MCDEEDLCPKLREEEMNEAVVEREVSFTRIWSYYYAMVMKKRERERESLVKKESWKVGLGGEWELRVF